MPDLVPIERIASKIYLIRDIRVMLDRDLAELYGVKTKALKQAVRMNINRFPDDFMFELTEKENRALRSQNVTLKRGQYSKYLPFAFTEQGVAMLSSVLNSDKDVHTEQIRKIYPVKRISRPSARLQYDKVKASL